MGELSAARQALEGAPVAPGTMATLRVLTDPERRPPLPRDGLSRAVAETQPLEQFELNSDEFLVCLRKARRGAAAGPSGMTSDHLFPVLESERASELLIEVASLLARGRVPDTILQAIRLGRLTALQKPDGGVRGIVVGDIIRRLVARTMAKQIAKKVETATVPFQYALKTKAGCECVAHVLQTLTDTDPEATVLSIDGVGAYDLISRNAMLEGLLRMEGGDQILPFVRCFYGSPSTYLWEDEMGVSQSIPQGEGGEQGDPLMPMLFALGQHAALEAIQARMRVGEHVFAYLDYIYTVSRPARIDRLHAVIVEELGARACIHLNHSKTQVWNRGGTEPSGVEVMTRAARLSKPGAVVWRGDPTLPPVQQGLKVLGVPIGQEAFVQHFLDTKSAEQQVLFERIPWVNHPQVAFLLLLMCGATRANFWLRALRPADTETFARRHDDNVWTCLREILGTPNAPAAARVLSTLALSAGGLGLVSAVRVRPAAHWASWADSLRMVRQRHPAIAERMVAGLEGDGPEACFQSVRQCQQTVLEAGLEMPHWQELADSPPPRDEEPEPYAQGRLAAAGNQGIGAQVRPRAGVADPE